MVVSDPTQFGVRLDSRLRPSWYTLEELEPSQKRPGDYLGKTPKYELQRDAEGSSYDDKWKARVQRYWWTHPYRCQACGLDGGSRPDNHWEGSVLVYRLDPYWERRALGDENDDTLASLCRPCQQELRYISNNTGEPMIDVVQRFTFRHQAAISRRQHLISKQAQERRHRRARKQEYDEKLAQHIERSKTEGIPIPREFVYEYADVYRPPSNRRAPSQQTSARVRTPSDLRCLDALK